MQLLQVAPADTAEEQEERDLAQTSREPRYLAMFTARHTLVNQSINEYIYFYLYLVRDREPTVTHRTVHAAFWPESIHAKLCH